MKKLIILLIIPFLFFSCKKEPVNLIKGFQLTQIEVKALPSTNSGTAWDSDGSNPEVYYKLYEGSTQLYDGSTGLFTTNATSPFTITDGLPISVSDSEVDLVYILELWDYDGSSDDALIEKMYFSLSEIQDYYEYEITEDSTRVNLNLVW